MKKRKRAGLMTYAQREYGVTTSQLKAFEKATERHYQKMKQSGKLVTISARELQEFLGSTLAGEQFLKSITRRRKGAKT
jgi:hypothetical protein